MSARESIFRVRELENGSLECEDWRGNTHRCTDVELGKTIRKVLADPDLPPVEKMSAGAYNAAEVFAKTVLPAHHHGMIRPLATMIVQGVERVMAMSSQAAANRAEAWRRQHQGAPRPPDPPPPHPPRDAHRRGHRVA